MWQWHNNWAQIMHLKETQINAVYASGVGGTVIKHWRCIYYRKTQLHPKIFSAINKLATPGKTQPYIISIDDIRSATTI